MSTPEGFTLYARPSRYLDLIGPLYEAVGDPAVVGLRIDERHTNARGFLHAGVDRDSRRGPSGNVRR